MLIKEDEILPAVKFNKIFLNKNVENQVTGILKEKYDMICQILKFNRPICNLLYVHLSLIQIYNSNE